MMWRPPNKLSQVKQFGQGSRKLDSLRVSLQHDLMFPLLPMRATGIEPASMDLEHNRLKSATTLLPPLAIPAL